jgi:uroporphyrinogen decarboxylase
MTDFGLPDFGRVEAALSFKEADRVPNFEVCVSRPVREAVFGVELPDGLATELFYRPKLGYDFIFLVPRYKKPPRYTKASATDGEASGRHWIDQHSNMISDWESFRGYTDYPEPSEPLEMDEIEAGIKAAAEQAGNLGVGALLPSCPFTEINLVMGYENFSIVLYDDYELCEAIVSKFGEVGVAEAEQLAKSDLDFVFFGDDMAYCSGMMVSPEIMRKLFFPWYRKYIGIIRDSGKPILFHSDGNISQVIPDFIEAGLNGLNPIEPLAMDIAELKKQYYGKLALNGNIDVDLLSRGTPDEVAALTKRRLDELKPGGGYLLGSSNSVCDYVKAENFLAMLTANLKFGGY